MIRFTKSQINLRGPILHITHINYSNALYPSYVMKHTIKDSIHTAFSKPERITKGKLWQKGTRFSHTRCRYWDFTSVLYI